MGSKRGDAMVEAAVVYPLVILIIASMLSISIELYSRAKATAEVNRAAVTASLGETPYAVTIRRAEWIL